MQQVARRPKSGAPFAVLTSRRTVALVERHRGEDVGSAREVVRGRKRQRSRRGGRRHRRRLCDDLRRRGDRASGIGAERPPRGGIGTGFDGAGKRLSPTSARLAVVVREAKDFGSSSTGACVSRRRWSGVLYANQPRERVLARHPKDRRRGSGSIIHDNHLEHVRHRLGGQCGEAPAQRRGTIACWYDDRYERRLRGVTRLVRRHLRQPH